MAEIRNRWGCGWWIVGWLWNVGSEGQRSEGQGGGREQKSICKCSGNQSKGMER